jgi:hypothetical protein
MLVNHTAAAAKLAFGAVSGPATSPPRGRGGGGGLVTTFIGGLAVNAVAIVSPSQQVFNSLNLATFFHPLGFSFPSVHSVAGSEYVQQQQQHHGGN